MIKKLLVLFHFVCDENKFLQKNKIRYVHFPKEAKIWNKLFSDSHFAQDEAVFMKKTQSDIKNSVLKIFKRLSTRFTHANYSPTK
jgi:hypothetical protein